MLEIINVNVNPFHFIINYWWSRWRDCKCITMGLMRTIILCKTHRALNDNNLSLNCTETNDNSCEVAINRKTAKAKYFKGSSILARDKCVTYLNLHLHLGIELCALYSHTQGNNFSFIV
jgi:hypothetical protein